LLPYFFKNRLGFIVNSFSNNNNNNTVVFAYFRALHKQENTKYKKLKKIKENKKNISEKNISERPRNYQKLVDKDQNIQD
jgi:hypothetical protein